MIQTSASKSVEYAEDVIKVIMKGSIHRWPKILHVLKRIAAQCSHLKEDTPEREDICGTTTTLKFGNLGSAVLQCPAFTASSGTIAELGEIRSVRSP